MQLDANLGFQVECMAVLIEREGGPSVWKFRISGSRDLQKMPAMREEHRVMLMTCTKSTKSMTKQNRQCTKQEGGGDPFKNSCAASLLIYSQEAIDLRTGQNLF